MCPLVIQNPHRNRINNLIPNIRIIPSILVPVDKQLYNPYIGNQVVYPVPVGILDYKGENTIGVAVWAQTTELRHISPSPQSIQASNP
jgi:hypothetical protein